MTTKQQQETARETYQQLRALVSPKIANIIEHPAKDPKILPKGNYDRVHIRILPVKSEMKPVGFWHGTGCYYEILIGPYKTESGLCLGEVQFFRYANQSKCGGKTFTPGLLKILSKAKATAPRGWTSIWPVLGGKFHFQKHYYAKDFKVYPCRVAAKDLAWLISETLPRFQAL